MFYKNSEIDKQSILTNFTLPSGMAEHISTYINEFSMQINPNAFSLHSNHQSIVPTLALTYLHKLLMLSLLVHHHEWHFCKTIATQKESSNAFIIHLSNKPDMYFANTTCIPFVDVCILISKYCIGPIIYFIEDKFPFSVRI